MENLKNLMTEIKKQKLSVSKTGLIKQNERNTMKSDLIMALMKDLPQNIVVGKMKEGIVLEIPNDNEGAIPMVLDIKIKNINFDTITSVEAYEKDKDEKAKKALERKKDQKASYNSQQKKKDFLEKKAE